METGVDFIITYRCSGKNKKKSSKYSIQEKSKYSIQEKDIAIFRKHSLDIKRKYYGAKPDFLIRGFIISLDCERKVALVRHIMQKVLKNVEVLLENDNIALARSAYEYKKMIQVKGIYYKLHRINKFIPRTKIEIIDIYE